MESARKLAEDWVAAWNARDLDAVMSHYSPEVVFESPRVAAAFHATGGQVGRMSGGGGWRRGAEGSGGGRRGAEPRRTREAGPAGGLAGGGRNGAGDGSWD